MLLILRSIVVVAAPAAAAILIFVHSGLIHVGADREHLPGVRWLLETVRASSIERFSQQIEKTEFRFADFDHPENVLNGLRRYRRSCLRCHGAPGVEPDPFAGGLNPSPPDLSKSRLEPAEVYWVVKHGLRMSAMPAFSQSQGDLPLAEIVVFVVALREMSAERYRHLNRKAFPPVESAAAEP